MPNEEELKIHTKPIPNIGGVVLFLSAAITLLISYCLSPAISRSFLVIIPASLLLILVGIADDHRAISPYFRFLMHVLVSIATISFGFHIDLFSSNVLDYLVTGLIIVGTINSINLLDGLDGLAVGVSAICCTAFALIAIIQNSLLLLALAVIPLGGLLGFLPYNFQPAKIFMGDSGSTLIGFFLSILIITTTSESRSALYLAASLLILGLPLLDTGFAIVRRIRKKGSIFVGDRQHFYDLLMERGFSVRRTVITGYFLSCAFAFLGLSTVKLLG